AQEAHEVDPVDPLHYEIVGARVVAQKVDDLHDVGVLHLGADASLLDEHVDVVLHVPKVALHLLDRDGSGEAGGAVALAFPDGRHAALPYRLEELVLARDDGANIRFSWARHVITIPFRARDSQTITA